MSPPPPPPPAVPTADELVHLLEALSDEAEQASKMASLSRLRFARAGDDAISQKIAARLIELLETDLAQTPVRSDGPFLQASNPFFDALTQFPIPAESYFSLLAFIKRQTDSSLQLAALACLNNKIARQGVAIPDVHERLKEEIRSFFDQSANKPELAANLAKTYQGLLGDQERCDFICFLLRSPQLELVRSAADIGRNWLDTRRHAKAELSEDLRFTIAQVAACSLDSAALNARAVKDSWPRSLEFECVRSLLHLLYPCETPTGRPSLFAELSKNSDDWISIASIHILGKSKEYGLPFKPMLMEIASTGLADRSREAAEALQDLSLIADLKDLESLRILISSEAAHTAPYTVAQIIAKAGSAAAPLFEELADLAKAAGPSNVWIESISEICSPDETDAWELFEYFLGDVRDEVHGASIDAIVSLLKREPDKPGIEILKSRAIASIQPSLSHETEWIRLKAHSALAHLTNENEPYVFEKMGRVPRQWLSLYQLPSCGATFAGEQSESGRGDCASLESLRRALESSDTEQQMRALIKIMQCKTVEQIEPIVPFICKNMIARDSDNQQLVSLRSICLLALSRFIDKPELWLGSLQEALKNGADAHFISTLICILRETRFSDEEALRNTIRQLGSFSTEHFGTAFECREHKSLDFLNKCLDYGSSSLRASVAYGLCMINEAGVKIDEALNVLLTRYPETDTGSGVYRMIGGCQPSLIGNCRSLFIAAIRRIDADIFPANLLREALSAGDALLRQAAEKMNAARSEQDRIEIDNEIMRQRELQSYVESIYFPKLHKHESVSEPIIKVMVNADGRAIWTEVLQTSGSREIDLELQWLINHERLPAFREESEQTREIIIDFNYLLAKAYTRESVCLLQESFFDRLKKEVNCYRREGMLGCWLFGRAWRPKKRYFQWSIQIEYDEQGKITRLDGNFPPDEEEKARIESAASSIDFKQIIEAEPTRWNRIYITGNADELALA